MRELLQQLASDVASRRSTAYCRLVETRGSTPQKAGAAMLVYEDGSQTGTLGGGCVEAEVKRRALKSLVDGAASVAEFQLNSDYGWDDGLICGGRMKVAIFPLTVDCDADYFQTFATLAENGGGCTEAIVFDADASGLAAPQLFVFDAEDRLAASFHAQDGALAKVVADYRPLKDRPEPYAAEGIAYLPLLQQCRLVIVGGGHVGQAVASLAASLDFDVWVVDDRDSIVSQERFPTASKRIAGSVETVLPNLDITPNTYCLIVTRGHNHDEQALFHLAERGACYVGLIGSRRKIRMIFEDLLEQGIAPESLERVYAPVGIEIGSRTVTEIAVSIAAELVAHRNLYGNVPARPDAVAFKV